jgi:hypothetical protein
MKEKCCGNCDNFKHESSSGEGICSMNPPKIMSCDFYCLDYIHAKCIIHKKDPSCKSCPQIQFVTDYLNDVDLDTTASTIIRTILDNLSCITDKPHTDATQKTEDAGGIIRRENITQTGSVVIEYTPLGKRRIGERMKE